MRMKFRLTILTLCLIVPLLATAQVQEKRVLVKFKEDANEKTFEYKIKLYNKETEIEPGYFSTGFILPDTMVSEKIGAKITFNNEEIDFGELERKYYDMDWVVGVDNKPYEKENVGHLPAEFRDKGNRLYFLEFRSGGWIKYKITTYK